SVQLVLPNLKLAWPSSKGSTRWWHDVVAGIAVVLARRLAGCGRTWRPTPHAPTGEIVAGPVQRQRATPQTTPDNRKRLAETLAGRWRDVFQARAALTAANSMIHDEASTDTPLHDHDHVAGRGSEQLEPLVEQHIDRPTGRRGHDVDPRRSEEHTSELQSRENL